MATPENQIRVALVNPSPNASFQPLNLAFLAAYCQKDLGDAIALRLFDSAVSKTYAAELLDWKPDIAGITCLSSDLLLVEQLIREVRAARPGCLIVCGGVHAAISPEDLLAIGADLAVAGEGEITFSEIIQTWREQGRDLSHPAWKHIHGLCYKKEDGSVETTPERELIMNLDDLPHPARHLFNNEVYGRRYFVQRGMRTDGVFTVHGSRGCPFRCYFCCVNFTVHGKVRLHSPGYIADEMQSLVETYRAKWIFFTDDTFLINKKHTAELCHEIIRRGLDKKVQWEAQVRSSLVREQDIDLLKLMRAAGCRQVDIGFETGNQRMLELIKGTGITVDDHRRALRLTKEAGIDVLGTFIIANPTETYAEMSDTVRFIEEEIRKGTLTRFQFGTAVPFPGTRLYQMAVEENVVPADYLSLLRSRAGAGFGSVLCTRNSTPAEVAAIETRLQALSSHALRWQDKVQWVLHNAVHNPRMVGNTLWQGLKSLFPARR